MNDIDSQSTDSDNDSQSTDSDNATSSHANTDQSADDAAEAPKDQTESSYVDLKQVDPTPSSNNSEGSTNTKISTGILETGAKIYGNYRNEGEWSAECNSCQNIK